jgi:hypothetical protein
MSFRRILLGIVCFAVVASAGMVYIRYVNEAEARLDPGDLIRRTALSNPDWANYQEDIKGQIGAGPVAQWQGKPTAVRREGGVVHVTFRLEGPWAARDVVVPVLMRDPLGNERRHHAYEIRKPEVVYTFKLSGESPDAPIPWIMVKYPHHEDRLTLDSEGVWRAE